MHIEVVVGIVFVGLVGEGREAGVVGISVALFLFWWVMRRREVGC